MRMGGERALGELVDQTWLGRSWTSKRIATQAARGGRTGLARHAAQPVDPARHRARPDEHLSEAARAQGLHQVRERAVEPHHLPATPRGIAEKVRLTYEFMDLLAAPVRRSAAAPAPGSAECAAAGRASLAAARPRAGVSLAQGVRASSRSRSSTMTAATSSSACRCCRVGARSSRLRPDDRRHARAIGQPGRALDPARRAEGQTVPASPGPPTRRTPAPSWCDRATVRTDRGSRHPCL